MVIDLVIYAVGLFIDLSCFYISPMNIYFKRKNYSIIYQGCSITHTRMYGVK